MGSAKLHALSNLAWAAFAEAHGSERTVLFILGALFEDFASSIEGEPIAASTVAQCCALIEQPVITALDWVIGNDGISDPMAIANGLTSAYARLREFL